MRKIMVILAATIVFGTLGSGLLLKAAGDWALAQLYPQPWADEMVRGYLAEVQAENWGAASAGFSTSAPDSDAGGIRARWLVCTAEHGPIVGYEARSKFLAPEQVEATVRFADGTVSQWPLWLSPRNGWKLYAVAPPACRIHP